MKKHLTKEDIEVYNNFMTFIHSIYGDFGVIKFHIGKAHQWFLYDNSKDKIYYNDSVVRSFSNYFCESESAKVAISVQNVIKDVVHYRLITETYQGEVMTDIIIQGKDGKYTNDRIEWFKNIGCEELEHYGYMSDDLVKINYESLIDLIVRDSIPPYTNKESIEKQIELLIKFMVAFNIPLKIYSTFR